MSDNVTRLPVLSAGAKPLAIVPTSMEDCYRLAKAVVAARMAPRGMDTAEACMVAIMHGLEVGLTPMAALQRIAVVNGRPVIWGDGAMGLVRASGLLEFCKEELLDGDTMAVCTVKRRGEQDAVVRTFTMADADRAGLLRKDGPWKQYPKRMLQMRARAFALRDVFADVLGGLYLREEVEDEAQEVRRLAPPPPPPEEPEVGPALEHKTADEIVLDLRNAPRDPEIERIHASQKRVAEVMVQAVADDLRERTGASHTRRSSEPYGAPQQAPPPPPEEEEAEDATYRSLAETVEEALTDVEAATDMLSLVEVEERWGAIQNDWPKAERERFEHAVERKGKQLAD